MNLFSRLPWNRKKQEKTEAIPQKKRKILVISGGGFRGTYALGILKAIEKNHIDKEIDAVYGVSIGAIIGSIRLNGMKAEDMFHILTQISIKDLYGKDVFTRSGGFFSNKKIQKMIKEYLPDSFDDLHLPFYAGVVDTNTAEFHLFSSGNLQTIVLGSMSIPGIFPPVKYEEYSLVDGGLLNNFPVDIAKKDYPDHEIIGIALNKFQTNQKITSAFDNLQIAFEVMRRSKLLRNTRFVDYLFYRDLPISVVSLNKKQMHEAFALGYEDGCKMFGKTNS